MDYSKLSTEDLIALKNGDLSKISTETLQALREQEVERSAPTKDESHPDISFLDRFNVKNLASNPEAGISYLQKQHPDMSFKSVNGEIQMRKKGESEYRVLDPSGFDLQDITDVAGDIAQGGAETVAGTAATMGSLNPLVGMGAMAATGVVLNILSKD